VRGDRIGEKSALAHRAGIIAVMPWHRWLARIMRVALLTLVTELTGRSITVRLDRAFHVVPLAAPTTPAYPFLLAGVRAVAALALAAIAWRLVRAHATAAAGEGVLNTVGERRGPAPRLHVGISARLWLLCFGATSLWFLAQDDAERLSQGRWPLLAPWLHTYALPVFAVLAVVLSLAWGTVGAWVSDVERYAATTFARACGVVRGRPDPPRRRRPTGVRAPRQLFGLSFESRPPPLRA
jgi:hypothetical protein